MTEFKNAGSDWQNAAPKIAIIGTEGSGKTVLVTTLAKRFSRASPAGVFLHPLDNLTIRYVERNWQILCSGDWPAGSPIGQMSELQWRLDCDGDCPVQCDLRIVDAAGQDLRRLFSDDEPTTAETNGPDHLRELKAYLTSADIVICLVNLQDFLGEGAPERRLDNEIVITSALRRLSEDSSRRLCLLFTQFDLYKGVLGQYGDLHRVVEHFLPYVHGAHLAKGEGQVKARMVAAVNKLRVVVGPDGKPRRVPAPGFDSSGFDGLMRWLVKEVSTTVAAREAARREAERVWRLRNEQEQGEKLILSLIVAAVVLIGLWWWMHPPAPRPLMVQKANYIFLWKTWLETPDWAATIEYGWFHDGISIRNDSGKLIEHAGVTLLVGNGTDGAPQEIPLGQLSNWQPGESKIVPNVASVTHSQNVSLRVDLYK